MKRIIDESIKNDFRYLRENKDKVYLNSSSTSLILDKVIDKTVEVYQTREKTLARTSSDDGLLNQREVEETFKAVAKHMNAPSEDVLLTYGTTYAINRIAFTIISELEDGDEILVGKMEHSANYLTWRKIAEQLKKDIKFVWYPMNGWEVDYEALKELINDKTKVMAVAHVYNTVGTKNDLSKIREAIGGNVKLFVDGAQAIGHTRIDVTKGDLDYYVFGAHKAFGSYGVGFAYIKNLYSLKDPLQFGGGMDIDYNEDEITYRDGKSKFLAGTMDVPAVIAFKEAIEYIDSIGIDEIESYNESLKKYAEEKISSIENVRIINEGVSSPNLFFEVKGVAGEDVGYHLGENKISVRTGAACVRITNGKYEPYKAVRASFHIYNSKEDVDKLYEALKSGVIFLEHYSTRDLLQKSVSNPKQKGLTEEQLSKSKPIKVEGCDDFFKIYIEVENEIVKVARYEGNGCAISVASTDILFNLIENKNIKEVSNIITMYKKFLNGEIQESGYEILDHFKLVQEHRSRIKCAAATLETLREEINN